MTRALEGGLSRPFHENVGRLDALLRALLVPLVLLGMIFALRTLHPDWAPSVMIHSGILLAYLLMSAGLRMDPFYKMLGFSTLRERGERGGRRTRKTRGRPMQ